MNNYPSNEPKARRDRQLRRRADHGAIVRGVERLSRAKKLARRRALINAAKSKPCADCGHTFDPVCMDFDHRPGEVKLFTIGSFWMAYSEEKTLAEIAKCDVVCSCCHRLRTHRDRDHRTTSGAALKFRRIGCAVADDQRGPVLCSSYPRCACGEIDAGERRG